MSNWMIIPEDSDLLHAFGHKYIEKKRGKNGKWYYIYQKAKNRIKRAIGLDQKEKLELAGKNLHNAVGKFSQSKDLNSATYWLKETKDAMKTTKKRKENFDNSLLGKMSNLKKNGLEFFNNLIGNYKQPDRLKDKWLDSINIKTIEDSWVPLNVKTIEDSWVPLNVKEAKIVSGGSKSTPKPNSGISKSTTPKSTSAQSAKSMQSKLSYSPSYTSKTQKKKATSFMNNNSVSRTGLVSGVKNNKGNSGKSVGSIIDPKRNTAIQRSNGAGQIGNTGTTIGYVGTNATYKKKRRKS